MYQLISCLQRKLYRTLFIREESFSKIRTQRKTRKQRALHPQRSSSSDRGNIKVPATSRLHSSKLPRHRVRYDIAVVRERHFFIQFSSSNKKKKKRKPILQSDRAPNCRAVRKSCNPQLEIFRRYLSLTLLQATGGSPSAAVTS